MKTINNLTEKEVISLEIRLVDVLQDKYWCLTHNINYQNPEVEKARKLIYKNYLTEKKNENN
jgi:hypothetical protein